MNLKSWLIAIAAAGGIAAASPALATPAPAPVDTTAAELPAETVAPEATVEDGEVEAEVAPFDYAVPVEGVGLPDGRMGLQDQYTDVGQRAADFHDDWLIPLITVISLFVLLLLIYAMIRFRRSAHPVPSRTTHNTMIEFVWTIVPVIILVVIAVPSIGLIRAQYDAPPADVTIKVTGHQWYWTYEYPDHGGVELVSNMLKEQGDVAEGQRFRTDADGPMLLAVDERLVIPAGKTVKFIVTASDVIHSFAMPAFWTKIDAVPGRLNETWVKVDKPGVYFGQCSELCGARHAYMPIVIEVVPEARFNSWIASKGGTMPGAEVVEAEEMRDGEDGVAFDPIPEEAEPNESAPAVEPRPAEVIS